MKLMWATRGRTWGFRFCLNAGFDDPLPEYDAAFSGVETDPVVCRRSGDVVALRFPDPEDRKDQAGRVIPHEFVVYPPLANAVNSVADGIHHVWPHVADNYARIWDQPASTLHRVLP